MKSFSRVVLVAGLTLLATSAFAKNQDLLVKKVAPAAVKAVGKVGKQSGKAVVHLSKGVGAAGKDLGVVAVAKGAYAAFRFFI